MIAFLVALAPFIPGILSIAGFLIKIFGTSEENLKAYQDMVQKNKDSGLVAVETSEHLDQMDKEIEAEQLKKQSDKKNG